MEHIMSLCLEAEWAFEENRSIGSYTFQVASFDYIIRVALKVTLKSYSDNDKGNGRCL
ncbi:hypothetical protein KHA80_00735 [Anaerobacillus sp. HL2]|nr:hypothetical protein KHA80_00735 [Anaerobacillus sp. HL2]